MQDRVIQFLVKHSRITEQRLREVMFRTGELVRDVGTVLIGRDAVEVGLIDELGGLNDAMGVLRRLIDARRSAAGNGAQGPRAGQGPWHRARGSAVRPPIRGSLMSARDREGGDGGCYGPSCPLMW